MHRLILLIITLIISSSSDAGNPPALTLAKTYKNPVDLKHYWVSEKLDGVRAYWNGKQLISRQGNPYPAPAWFTRRFPDQALDGELWIARGRFQQLLSTVKKHQAVNKEWRHVKYFVFDLPRSNKTFSQRLITLQQLVNHTNSPYLILLKQYKLANETALMQALEHIKTAGGEGLMLHRADAFYHSGRNNDLLKVKPYYDAEAIVIAHIPGKGKYTGMLGSLLVKTAEGLQFRIGSGFSDLQRQTPPAIGTLITYTYHNKTDQGIPKFASFLRIRKTD